jgi:hypothetical protein
MIIDINYHRIIFYIKTKIISIPFYNNYNLIEIIIIVIFKD